MKHSVEFDIPRRDLGKADIHFEVKVDGQKLGKLEISRGSLVWYPRDMTYGHKLTWSQFDKLVKAGDFPRAERRKDR